MLINILYIALGAAIYHFIGMILNNIKSPKRIDEYDSVYRIKNNCNDMLKKHSSAPDQEYDDEIELIKMSRSMPTEDEIANMLIDEYKQKESSKNDLAN